MKLLKGLFLFGIVVTILVVLKDYTDGIVQQRKFNGSVFVDYKKLLEDYANGECSVVVSETAQSLSECVDIGKIEKLFTDFTLRYPEVVAITENLLYPDVNNVFYYKYNEEMEAITSEKFAYYFSLQGLTGWHLSSNYFYADFALSEKANIRCPERNDMEKSCDLFNRSMSIVDVEKEIANGQLKLHFVKGIFEGSASYQLDLRPPKNPVWPSLTKDEFETNAEFELRKQSALNDQKQLQNASIMWKGIPNKINVTKFSIKPAYNADKEQWEAQLIESDYPIYRKSDLRKVYDYNLPEYRAKGYITKRNEAVNLFCNDRPCEFYIRYKQSRDIAKTFKRPNIDLTLFYSATKSNETNYSTYCRNALNYEDYTTLPCDIEIENFKGEMLFAAWSLNDEEFFPLFQKKGSLTLINEIRRRINVVRDQKAGVETEEMRLISNIIESSSSFD